MRKWHQRVVALRSSSPSSLRPRRASLPDRLLQSGVAVGKLFFAKFAKMKLRQDALQSIFSVRLDFSIPQILAVFGEKGVFQHPQAITLRVRGVSRSRLRQSSCGKYQRRSGHLELSPAAEHDRATRTNGYMPRFCSVISIQRDRIPER